MGKRIKSMIALMVVLLLIYMQQAAVIYAEGNEPVNADICQEGEEPKDEDEEDEDDDEEEEKPSILQYKATIPKPDGKNGYFVTKPKVVIAHISERGVTKFQLVKDHAVLAEGELLSQGETAELFGDAFQEGEQEVVIWMEDEEGNIIEEFRKKELFQIDTAVPEIQMEAPKGFDVWYPKSVSVSVSSADKTSGVKTLQCYVNGKFTGEKEAAKGQFEISEASAGGQPVEVTIAVEDEAGNKVSQTRKIYIDHSAPSVAISGAEQFMITSEPLTVTYEVAEDNVLREFSAFADWENVNGEKSVLSVSEWENVRNGKKTKQTLSEDGIYQLHVGAKDFAGHQSEKKMQVIIDKENPVIRHIEDLDGKYLREFCWAQAPDELVQDFTTFTYEVSLDGNLYTFGKQTRTEGNHILEVHARDAAGNEAKAKASFVIDRTPPEILFSDIEEGQEYEEESTFRISLANAEDTILQVQINGENQKIRAGSKTVQYTVQEHQNYEVKVKAVDKAGNQSEKSIFFAVVPKKTLLQKVVDTKTKSTKTKDIENEYVGNGYPIKGALVIGGIIAAAAIAAGVWYYRKMQKEYEEEEEESV